MAYNVPTTTSSRFSFGPGVLYMGVEGTTPLVDIGTSKGASISVERKPLEVKQGSPQVLVGQYVIEETVGFKIVGMEWNFDNLAYALGAGVTAGIGTYQETFEFGGDMAKTNRALRFVHRTPDGSTIDIHIFKAQGSSKIDVSFSEAELHEFPYEFAALEGTTNFAGAALASNKKLFKVIRTRAA